MASMTPGTPVYTPAGNRAVYVRPAPGGHQGQPEESHIVRLTPTFLLPGTGPVLVVVEQVFAEPVAVPRGNEVIR